MFIIHQYTDNIEVFKNDILYLNVVRRFNLLGQLSTSIYKGDLLLMKSTYDVVFFQLYLNIKYQNSFELKSITLIRKNKQYVMYVENKQLILKRYYFKNPIYTIMNNEELLGEVHAKLNGLTDTPIVYNLNLFDKNEEFEVYYLIRFLIQIPPTMDV